MYTPTPRFQVVDGGHSSSESQRIDTKVTAKGVVKVIGIAYPKPNRQISATRHKAFRHNRWQETLLSWREVKDVDITAPKCYQEFRCDYVCWK